MGHFSKAFATIDHAILSEKICHYGIRGTAPDWFNSYLSGRKQYVTYNGISSNTKTVHSWTKGYRIYFQRVVTSWWLGKSTICQFRNRNTSYFYKFLKCHRCRRNGHGSVPLNNGKRFNFAMSTYTMYTPAAHHCYQRWTCMRSHGTQKHSLWIKLQQFQLRELSPD